LGAISSYSDSNVRLFILDPYIFLVLMRYMRSADAQRLS